MTSPIRSSARNIFKMLKRRTPVSRAIQAPMIVPKGYKAIPGIPGYYFDRHWNLKIYVADSFKRGKRTFNRGWHKIHVGKKTDYLVLIPDGWEMGKWGPWMKQRLIHINLLRRAVE